VILDCCYAAAAFQAWQMQSGDALNTAIMKAAERQFSSRSGTALLCACNEDQWALYRDDDLTMFSGALMSTLRRGCADLDDYLSIEEVHRLVCQGIRERHDNQSVEPVLHIPKGRREALAAVRIFPNAARRGRAPAQRIQGLQSELDRLKDHIAKIQDELGTAAAGLVGEPPPATMPAHATAPAPAAPEPVAAHGQRASADAAMLTAAESLPAPDSSSVETATFADGEPPAPASIERMLRLREQDRRRALGTAVSSWLFLFLMAIVFGVRSLDDLSLFWLIPALLLLLPLALHLRGLKGAVSYQSYLRKDRSADEFLSRHRDIEALLLKKRTKLFGGYFVTGIGFRVSLAAASLSALLALLLLLEGDWNLSGRGYGY
jgi:hypothetical protein